MKEMFDYITGLVNSNKYFYYVSVFYVTFANITANKFPTKPLERIVNKKDTQYVEMGGVELSQC